MRKARASPDQAALVRTHRDSSHVDAFDVRGLVRGNARRDRKSETFLAVEERHGRRRLDGHA